MSFLNTFNEVRAINSNLSSRDPLLLEELLRHEASLAESRLKFQTLLWARIAFLAPALTRISFC